MAQQNHPRATIRRQRTGRQLAQGKVGHGGRVVFGGELAQGASVSSELIFSQQHLAQATNDLAAVIAGIGGKDGGNEERRAGVAAHGQGP